LLLTADRRATPGQRAALDQALAGAAALDAVDVEALARLVAATGAVDEVEEMIQRRVEAALAALTAAPIDSTACRMLARLARAVAHRRA
jgi:geranylgeranyl diphosphate synthase type I